MQNFNWAHLQAFREPKTENFGNHGADDDMLDRGGFGGGRVQKIEEFWQNDEKQ